MPACIYLSKLEKEIHKRITQKLRENIANKFPNHEINFKSEKVISHLRNNLTNEK